MLPRWPGVGCPRVGVATERTWVRPNVKAALCSVTPEVSLPCRPVLPGGAPGHLRAHCGLCPRGREQSTRESFPREPDPGRDNETGPWRRPCAASWGAGDAPSELRRVPAPFPDPGLSLPGSGATRNLWSMLFYLLYFPKPPFIQVLPFAKPWKPPPWSPPWTPRFCPPPTACGVFRCFLRAEGMLSPPLGHDAVSAGLLPLPWPLCSIN